MANWSDVINGHIDVPDDLMILFNKVGTQIRFHTISGKTEVETIAHIIEICQDFFIKYPDRVNCGKILGSAKLTKPDQITETDRKESV